MNTHKTIHDLLSDASFQRWAQNPGGPEHTQWEEWVQASPHNAELAEEAKVMLKGIPFVRTDLPAATINHSWQKLSATLQLKDPGSPPPSIGRRRIWRRIAAAAAVLLLAGSFAFWFFRPAYVTYQTGYGERLDISLSDGSTLLLNANSSLGFYDNFSRRSVREVFLEGEAYLEVNHLPDQRRFLVQTDDLTVEVLGTSFNVHSRNTPSVVSLENGVVKLKTAAGASLVLSPGQSAWFDHKKKAFRIEAQSASNRSAWVEKRWVFEEPVPFASVLEQISDLYGLSWELENPALLDKELSGGISIESKEVLLHSLSVALDVEIIESGNRKIFIKE